MSVKVLLANTIEQLSCNKATPRMYSLVVWMVIVHEGCVEKSVAIPGFFTAEVLFQLIGFSPSW